jgi:Xaa-Pro dipeptidase
MNVPRARALLSRDRLDALIASGFENLGYVSGFVPPSTWWLRRRDLFGSLAVAVPEENGSVRRIAIVPRTHALHYLNRDLGSIEVVPYGYFPIFEAARLDESERRFVRALHENGAPDTIQALAGVIDNLGLRRSRIGIDTTGLGPADYEQIARALEGVTLVPATDLFREIRAVKTPEEVRRLREAAAILRGAVVGSARAAYEGMSEIELAREFVRRVVAADASPTFIAIGFGEHTALPGVLPSERRLRRGDLIRYDCGCVYDLYHSDHARTFAFGTPTDAARRYYRATLEGERRAIGRAAPGVPVREVFAVAVETVRKSAIPHYERSHVGHSIGLEVYEYPMFRPDSEAILEPNMTLTIEVPYYEIGTGGFMPEDVVRITESAAEPLTEPDSDLVIL